MAALVQPKHVAI